MPSLSLATVGLLLIGYPVYLYLASIVRERRFQAFAKANGCHPAHNDDSPYWPWGLDRMYRVLTARSRGLDTLDDCFVAPLNLHPTLEHAGLFGDRIMETMEPQNIKTILQTKFQDWEIGWQRHQAFTPAIGRNIFTSDGPEWEKHRAVLRPQFSREKINDLQGMESELKTFYQAVEGEEGVREDGWTRELNVLPLLFRFVLDNATGFIFGEAVGSQKAHMGKSEGDEFAEAFDLGSHYMLVRIRLQHFVALGTSKEFRKACRVMRELPGYYARRALNGEHKRDPEKFDLLSSMAEQTQNPDELRDQALALLVAGRDTTSALLAWTLILLGQNSRVFSKLRQVIADEFPPDGESILDFRQLKACRYLQYVLNETLRLYDVAPLNNRVALRDTVLPVGGGPDGDKPVAVRKGQQVLWNTYAMHRRQDLWGDDVMDFKPERWEDPKRTRLLSGGWAYLPFSGGPRTCIGQQFALTEASYSLVRLLQRYDGLELAPDSAAAKGERIGKTVAASMAPLELRLKLHKAE